VINIGPVSRGYPLRFLVWHEVVNDWIGEVPVVVSFCPLCGVARAFRADLQSATSGVSAKSDAQPRPLTFGGTGVLYNGYQIMYDRQTRSWWDGFTGRSVAGMYLDRNLEQVPVHIESWGDFRKGRGSKQVMMLAGTGRSYGHTPYAGLEDAEDPFMLSTRMEPESLPPRVGALSRVIRVGRCAWLASDLTERLCYEQATAGEDFIVDEGLEFSLVGKHRSVVDRKQISRGRMLDTFAVHKDGALVPHDRMFAYAFATFVPDGKWLMAREGSEGKDPEYVAWPPDRDSVDCLAEGGGG